MACRQLRERPQPCTARSTATSCRTYSHSKTSGTVAGGGGGGGGGQLTLLGLSPPQAKRFFLPFYPLVPTPPPPPPPPPSPPLCPTPPPRDSLVCCKCLLCMDSEPAWKSYTNTTAE